MSIIFIVIVMMLIVIEYDDNWIINYYLIETDNKFIHSFEQLILGNLLKEKLALICEKGENGRIIPNQQVSITMNYLPENIKSLKFYTLIFCVLFSWIIQKNFLS